MVIGQIPWDLRFERAFSACKPLVGMLLNATQGVIALEAHRSLWLASESIFYRDPGRRTSLSSQEQQSI